MVVPPLDHLDRLPDSRAVWRTDPPHSGIESFRQVSVDYGDGLIERTTVGEAAWSRVERWRWGWA